MKDTQRHARLGRGLLQIQHLIFGLGKFAFTNAATVVAVGTSSCSKPSRLGSNFVVRTFTPVALPPGRLKLAASRV